MSDQNEYADLDWRGGNIPVAKRFDDPYFSLDDGVAETRHVFLAGNDLPTRFRDGFHIAELGFGTGLNLLCAWKAWRAAGFESPLRFTSFEAFPLSRNDLLRAQGTWLELTDEARDFQEIWDAEAGRALCATLDAQIIYGDARQTLNAWDGLADAWFLDGFSPAKNPELWQVDLMQAVAQHTAQGGSFATYTAAGHVRSALSDAGFSVERIVGFSRKRHMTIGELK
jgi:tRNA U34 5-methylaminomethyl-2-thiouridine-forming methyltransferase MnmC